MLAALASALSIGAVVVGASGDRPADVDRAAERVLAPVGDRVSIYDSGEVDTEVVRGAADAARRAGGVATVARTGSLGMRDIRRDGSVVHAPPSGYLIPTVYLAVPERAIARVVAPDITPLLGWDRVVMNEQTAALTGARAGDRITMQAANGQPVRLIISDVRPVEQLGSAELVFTFEVAERLGATEDTRVILFDFDRSKIDAALSAVGLSGRANTRVYRSWQAPNPDDSLSTMRTKILLGEPWYRFEADGSITMHPTWVANNLTSGRVLLNDAIPIRARCHVQVVDDLKAALAEVAAAGLGWAIDVANANTYGGCYAGARFSRQSGQIGFLSRHSYGMALDTNTVSNCFACVPRMDCRVVRIFRKHNFGWGGNYYRSDGMHFEWVGERRDTWTGYPSPYCPNVAGLSTGESASSDTAGAPTSSGVSGLGADVLTLGGEGGLHGDH